MSCCGSTTNNNTPADTTAQQNEGGCCPPPTTNQGGCCDDQTSCCPPTSSSGGADNAAVTEMVRAGYADVSKKTTSGRTQDEEKEAMKIAEGMGYSAEELMSIPVEANMGLQCGNPTKIAGLKSGEVVVDLGSGGGVDCFLAARVVGETGKVIGIDMTTEMIEQARASAAKAAVKNVEFVQSKIEEINLPDNTADVIISNCVINLAPNKMDVFKEMFRVLKPGGRVAVSDVVLTEKPMPDEIKNSVTMLVGCVAGAIPAKDYVSGLKSFGFQDVKCEDGGQDLNAMWNPEKQAEAAKSNCATCTTTCCAINITDLPKDMVKFDINEYVFSGKVMAVKPLATDQEAGCC